ncbi:MAG: hypothetical protein IPL91_12355 [Hyphomicrobium sp.]|nr:hypothetical protein [Hyphomicrobium sp.]
MEYYVHEFVKAYAFQMVHCSLRQTCPKVNFFFENGEGTSSFVILMHYDGKGVRFGQ